MPTLSRLPVETRLCRARPSGSNPSVSENPGAGHQLGVLRGAFAVGWLGAALGEF